MKVTYYYQSGFSVEMAQCVLLFDYWQGELPQWDRAKPLYVFVSHGHADHYNPEIFELKDKYEKVYYIMYRDIKNLPRKADGADVTAVGTGKTYRVGGLTVKTYFSTDEGVAYVVEAYGRRILHFGDLNWWHWNGEADAINQWQKVHYQKTVLKLKDDHYDLVFGPPLDYRLEEHFWLGMAEFLKYNQPDILFPMHFWDEYQMIDKYLEAYGPEKTKIRTKIIRIHHKNEVFDI